MPIPRRFAPPNPAADELRARAEALPAAEKAQVEAALPGGGQAVSLAMPGQPLQPVPTNPEPVGKLPVTVPSMESMFHALKQSTTAQKIPDQETPAQRQINATGLTVKAHGYVVITPRGLGYLVDFGLL
jgi:hypothetical protein